MVADTLSPQALLRSHALRQWLTEPRQAANLEQLAAHVLGIQAQIPTSPMQAACARLTVVGPEAVGKELTSTRRLVRTWTVRGTMHLLSAADLPICWRALQPEWQLRWSRFLDKHVTREQRQVAGEAIIAVLTHGPMTRGQLLKAVQNHLGCREEWLTYLFSAWGGALKDLAYRGAVLHCGEQAGESLFVRTENWLDLPPCGLDPDVALAELLRRYLATYGPATVQDFVYWSGVTMQRARTALGLLGDGVRESRTFLDLADLVATAGEVAPVRLLPKFDPYLLAHKEKLYLAPEHYRHVFRPLADVAAVVLLEGMVAGVWRWERQGKGRRIAVELFAPPSAATQRRLDDEVEMLSSPVSGASDPPQS